MITFASCRYKWFPVVLATVLLLAGCASSRCQPGAGQAIQIYTLYFGRSVKGRAPVGDQEWRDFRNQVITPALPEGYTVLDGQGAWMNPHSRETIAEATKVLIVAIPEAADSLTIINRIRSSWQHRFHQYVVGMTVQSGCGSFSAAEAPK
jgi:Protein of unknown function (DUF3574)